MNHLGLLGGPPLARLFLFAWEDSKAKDHKHFFENDLQECREVRRAKLSNAANI